MQYAETLRRKLEATRRDVRAVDWENEVPDLIDEALSHIQDRFRAENAILKNITLARDDADDADRKRRAAELVDIVRDCIRRHTQLQARLLEAGATFRAEQDRQQFSGPPTRATVDLFGQLLMPTLGLPLADAARPAGVFFQAGTGIRVPSAPGLVSIVHMLLSPPADRDNVVGDVLPQPEFAPAPDPDRYTEKQWRESEELLASLETGEVPGRLSGLLAQARTGDPDLPRLVALRVLHAFAPELGTALRQGDQRILIAADDGAELTDEEFGGADLLVARARVNTEEDMGANHVGEVA